MTATKWAHGAAIHDVSVPGMLCWPPDADRTAVAILDASLEWNRFQNTGVCTVDDQGRHSIIQSLRERDGTAKDV